MSTRLAWLAAVAGVCVVYLCSLSAIGTIGPDEPRYASIGREMAISADWVTPRLWGEPWFEKPALLYWMVGLGMRAGLGTELGPRLPVALAGVVFLIFYFLALRREFGHSAALFASLILGTSAAWLAFSYVAVTDLPLAVTFSAFMLTAMRWIDSGSRRTLVTAGVLLGLAVLAKGLVPLALAAPLAWFGRRRIREVVPGALTFVLVAAPWYVLCWMRNGQTFVDEFFWKHHVERFGNNSLAHVQPFWFYVPVLAAGLFPWTPLVAHLGGRAVFRDWKRQLLAAWVVFGFVFFSASTNKLPGYLLPLVPAVCALMGITLAEARRARWTLAVSSLLLALLPAIAQILPAALRSGLRRASWTGELWLWLVPAAALASAVWWLAGKGRLAAALLVIAVITGAGMTAIKATVAPQVDAEATPRPLWRSIEPRSSEVCVGQVHRAWRYGLNYYSVTPLPDCQTSPRPLEIRQERGSTPFLVPRKP